VLAVALLDGGLAATAGAQNASYRDRLAQDEVIYFLLPDRFENGDRSNDQGHLHGTRLQTGFDPADKGFYHGGDLAGVRARLDYIQALGATAIWLAPVFVNQPVQGPPGRESAGYHGYWITDFTHVDPHLGSNAELTALVDAAHARAMKVYLDIVVNHTADVIAYRECSSCPYRSRADYPYQRRGGVDGVPINQGFAGDDAANQTEENFGHLLSPDFAYTPYVPAGKAHLKVPQWLNDPIYYHNRGESTFAGESSTMGDFFGLDDIMTEHPRVLRGFIDIYGAWIDQLGIDGYRIDTARHVNPEFFRAFVPAMLSRARAKGIENFHIFGEVYSTDPAMTALHTHTAALPSVLDFPFAQTVRDVSLGIQGTDALAALFAQDPLYRGGVMAAMQLPIFISNHDQGRFGYFLFKHAPQISNDEALQRMRLAYALTFLLRGVPVIYYGDEQGFAGIDGDMGARQDMFASRVESYNAGRVVGDKAEAGAAHFNPQHPMFAWISDLARLRAAHAALRRGRQVVRVSSAEPGVFVVSRFDPDTEQEFVLAFNSASDAKQAWTQVQATSTRFQSLHGGCEPDSRAASYHVALPAFGFVACVANLR
jgi:glycosidase